MAKTPEFIRWAIEYLCPLRETADWQSPESTQRQLRGIRAYSECAVEGRILDGICVKQSRINSDCESESVTGFYADEVFSFFGGKEIAESHCRACPANVLASQDSRHLAGCFGMIEWSDICDELFSVVDRVVNEEELGSQFHANFATTTPAWYGLWIDSPLDARKVELLIKIFENFAAELKDDRFELFLQAMILAHSNCLPLHISYFPCGESNVEHWTVVAHCPRCKAEMRQSDRWCNVCGRSGGPNPLRRRKIRGSRPYRPLREFLARENVDGFLERYFD